MNERISKTFHRKHKLLKTIISRHKKKDLKNNLNVFETKISFNRSL